jgi:hypothetical protein
VARCARRGQTVSVAGKDDQGLEAVAHGIATGHEGRPGRGADHHAVERLETDSALSQGVDVGRFDVAAPIPQVGVAQT